MSLLLPGIYRHFKKGDLYFAEGLEFDADVDEERLRVRYWALYPGPKLPFSRSLSSFNEMVDKPKTRLFVVDGNLALDPVGQVKKFDLIKALSVKKVEMLLPNAKICSKNMKTSHYLVQYCAEENKKIIVCIHPLFRGGDDVGSVSIDEYINFFESAE